MSRSPSAALIMLRLDRLHLSFWTRVDARRQAVELGPGYGFLSHHRARGSPGRHLMKRPGPERRDALCSEGG